jgi:hypothetical protein
MEAGMGWLAGLLGLAAAPDDPPVPPAPGHRRLHVFAGSFGSEDAVQAYCYDATDAVHPEALTRDLPGAFIDTDFVDVLFGPALEPGLTRALGADLAQDLLLRAAGHDSIVVIDERGFGGFPFTLNDTPRLSRIGAYDVPA